jgi:hypothetical protein
VLGSNAHRYFTYLVCVHDAPVDLTSASSGVSFATDLVVAFRVMSLQPAEVDSSTLSTGSAIDTACDPAAHPLILDGDGKVESLNADALGALMISDM